MRNNSKGLFRKQLILLRTANPIAVDFVVANRVRFLAAGVAGVAFYGVDDAVFDFFDNADMVGDAVLSSFFGVVPIEEDNVSGVGGVGVVLPLVTILEPVLANIADGEAGENTVFQIATLIGTPTDKDGTPIYSFIEAVPSPVGFATDIADL